MKKSLILFLSLIITGFNFIAQSAYEIPVSVPAYNSADPTMYLITPTNNGWSQINNSTYTYFYVEPGDYYGSIGTISLIANGTAANPRYISLHNGNNTHPGKLSTTDLANVVFSITGDYWVIDRMALFTTNTAPMRLENANNNIINRFYALNAGDIGFRNGCDGNTVQNCRMEILDRTIFPDRPAFGMINYSSSVGHMIANAQITNTHIVNNETYNYVDGFQSVLHDHNATTNITGVNYEGTVVDHNHFYVDSLMYTNCNGVYNTSGVCAYSENGIDLKCGSENPANPMIITNNKMWGYRKSDHTGSNLSDWGSAIVAHYGVNNVLIEDNVFFNSDRGITMSGLVANFGTVPDRAMLNSTYKNNIIYNIKEFAFYQQATNYIAMEGNLFKDVCHSGYWTWGVSDDGIAALGSLPCSNFTFINNMVVNAGNAQGSANPAITGSTTYSGNQYYDALPGSYSHSSDVTHTTDPTANYCDLVFTTDRYTNNPWVVTLPKVLAPAQCVPCTPTSNLAIDTACFSYVWAVNGQTYTSSGTYVDISSINGCAHTDSLILTIDNSCPQPTGVYLEAECPDVLGTYWSEVNDASASNGKYLEAQPGFWNTGSALGNGIQTVITYNFNVATAGSYYFNARVNTPSGGDSFYFRINNGAWQEWHLANVTALTWQQNSTLALVAGSNTLDISLREGSLILDKLGLLATNTLPSGAGGTATNCISCSATNSLLTTSSCQSYTWSVNGQSYTTSGTYTDVSTNTGGCTHTDSLVLTINNATSNMVSASACQSYTWAENGQTYTSSGTYTDVSTNVNGCTHTESLVLTINSLPTVNAGSNQSICSGVWTTISGSGAISYSWNQGLGAGTSHSVSPTFTTNYTVTGTDANGCIDTDVVQVAVNSATSNTVSASACQSYTWAVTGQTYTSSGTYTDISTNINGCIHTDSLVLTISNMTSSVQSVSSCQPYTWNSTGQTYISSGTYTNVTTNGNGCAHTDSLVLTISNMTSSVQSVSSCQPYTWNSTGQTYTSSGTYTNVTTNGNGCTHTDSLVLTIGNMSSSVQIASACQSYTWSISGQTYTTSGTYTDVSTNGNGCTSIDSLILTIGSVDVSVTSTNSVLEANLIGATYQWIDCNSGALIAGATNRIYVPVVNGTYAVIVSSGVCTDTSSCYAVFGTGIRQNENNYVEVYPNPVVNNVNVQISNSIASQIEVYNQLGEIVIDIKTNELITELNLSELSSGVYFIRVYNSLFDERVRIIKP